MRLSHLVVPAIALGTIVDAIESSPGLRLLGLPTQQWPRLRRGQCRTLRAPGSFTSGEIDAVFGVGPNAPAAKRGRSGVEYFAQAALASRAAWTFISWTRCSMW
jgi:hypothetical protein